LFFEQVILLKFAIFLKKLANVLLGEAVRGAFPRKEGGMQVLADLAKSSQTVADQNKGRIHFNGKILSTSIDQKNLGLQYWTK
jgi:hypothetical protein